MTFDKNTPRIKKIQYLSQPNGLAPFSVEDAIQLLAEFSLSQQEVINKLDAQILDLQDEIRQLKAKDQVLG